MNVLICDDDASTRFVLRRILSQNLGWSVSESSDGVDALSQLARRRFDLLLLDLEMPAFTGWEVLEVLRDSKQLHDLPVVIVSQERRRDIIMRLRQQQVAGYLLKPIRAEQVADRLASLKLKAGAHAGLRSDISNLFLSPDTPAILADGNLDYRHFFAGEAERHGTIRIAESAASAVAQYRKAPVDVVFVGSRLGVMSAEMMIRKVREAAADRPVRIVGIVDGPKKEEDAARLGFDDVMTRSFLPAIFNRELKRFVRPSGPVAALEQMLPEFRSAAISAVSQVFGMMLGAEVEPLEDPVPMEVALQATIKMEIEDRLRIDITVHVSEAAVDEVNGILIGADASDGDRAATTGELVNLVAGRLHAHVGESSLKSTCSLPDTTTLPTFQPAPGIAEDQGSLLPFRTAAKALFAVSLVVALKEEGE